MNPLKKVKEFHTTFKHPILSTPQIPEHSRAALRVNLLEEELKELEQAIKDKDIVEIADALCDLQYVLSGAVLEFGLFEKFPKLFEEVHRSNMSKTCSTEEEAKETVIFHTKNGDDGYYVYDALNKVYLVYRNSDNKLLKSVKYSPVNLKKILDEK